MKKENTNSKDLGIVIGTKEQSRWKTIQKNAEVLQEQLELQLLVNQATLQRAELELMNLAPKSD